MYISGILHPLATPETLKNLPMCKFEESAYGNGHIFQNVVDYLRNEGKEIPKLSDISYEKFEAEIKYWGIESSQFLFQKLPANVNELLNSIPESL